MLVRLFLMLALVFSTLPAPAAAAPACHDASAAAMPSHGMTMDESGPEPAPVGPMKMGKALCVGCIAPATLKLVRVAPRRVQALAHGLPPLIAGAMAATSAPEPPPPRG